MRLARILRKLNNQNHVVFISWYEFQPIDFLDVIVLKEYRMIFLCNHYNNFFSSVRVFPIAQNPVPSPNNAMHLNGWTLGVTTAVAATVASIITLMFG